MNFFNQKIRVTTLIMLVFFMHGCESGEEPRMNQETCEVENKSKVSNFVKMEEMVKECQKTRDANVYKKSEKRTWSLD